MTDQRIAQAAEQLRTAAEQNAPCEPIRELFPDGIDVATAYAVQSLNVQVGLDAGRRIVGRKIGLTSTAVQKQLGVDQPDYGALFADMEVSDGAEVDASRLLQPRAEAEVAVVLEHDLDKGEHGFAEVLRAVAFVVPAIEIVDSRIADWNISLGDTIADNASCGLYVVGSRPVALADVDLRAIQMSMTANDEEVSTGTGADCLGNPLHALRWLADVMCANGTPLRAGEVVMTGALGPMKPIAAGDRIEAHFSGLGSVTATLSPGAS